MPEASKCPHCGSTLPNAGWEGLCPNCVVRVSLETPVRSEAGSGLSALPSPSVPLAEPMGEGAWARAAREAERSPDAESPALNPQPGPGRIHYFGDYELLEEIARGGMGVVYKARQVSLNRWVAVKMILSGEFASAEFVQRFHKEAEAAANLHHPNIVAIHEVGVHEGRHYFSMDYVEGKNLAQWIADCRLPIADFQKIGRYVKQIAEAIHYAHERGILHRDLKPSNVLIDANDQPRITDFGLAKRLGDSEPGTQNPALTLTGQVLGSPSYMPPEQAEGKHRQVTIASDIYSLGAILYHLLTGRPPFAAATLTETLRQLLHSEPPSLRLLNPGVPRDLETICLKCLNKEPRRRYATAQELADELGRFLRNESILARPAGRVEKTWRWCRRHPAVASLACSLVVCLLLGVSGVVWQWQRAEDKARESRDRLVPLQVANGIRFQEADDLTGALLWFAESIRLKPEQDLHRIRFASALRQCPRLAGLWARQGPFLKAMFSPDGSKVAIVDYRYVLHIVAADTGTSIATWLPHRDVVHSVAFSPDGLIIFTTSFDKTGRAWRATNGQPLGPPLPLNNTTYSRTRFSAAFSPDGRRLVTRCNDCYVRIWDPTTGQPLTPPMPHSSHVSCATFSPDGHRLFTGSLEGPARMWDADSGEPLTTELMEIQAAAHAAFSHDGRYLFTASLSGTTRVWNTTPWTPVTPVWSHDEFLPSRPAEPWVEWAEFSPDDAYVATACLDQTARIWDVATGKARVAPLRHSEQVRYAHFSPDGRWLLTAGEKQMRVWNAASGQPVTPPLFVGSWLALPSFDADCRRVSVINGEGTCRSWDLPPDRGAATVALHEGGMRDAVLNARANVAITLGKDDRLCTWELAPGAALKSARPYDKEVRQFSSDREGHRLVIMAWEDGTTRVWDTRTGQPITPPLPHNARVSYATLSPDGRKVLTTAEDRTLRVWDASTGQPLTPPIQCPNVNRYAEFSSDGKYIVTARAVYIGAREPSAARLWDARTGKPVGNPLAHAPEDTVPHASFSPNSRWVVTASSDQTAQIWSTSTGQRVGRPMKHYDVVNRAEFSPDGRRVLTTSGNGILRVWDADTGEPVSTLVVHGLRLSRARFSPDSRFIAAENGFGVRVWDAASGQPVTPWLRTANPVGSCEFSADGHRLFTASTNGAILSWDLAPDDRSASELTALAKLMAGRTLNANGELISLDPPAVLMPTNNLLETLRPSLSPPLSTKTSESVRLWRSLRARYPTEFSTLPAQALNWHESRARECERDKDWFAARFHLNRLLEVKPDDSKIRQRRDLAQTELDNTRKAP